MSILGSIKPSKKEIMKAICDRVVASAYERGKEIHADEETRQAVEEAAKKIVKCLEDQTPALTYRG